MSAAREKDQADFDLERFIDTFDEAMTSRDPRVIETLRSLMMIVALTRPETPAHAIDLERGPLRRMFEDVRNLNRRMYEVEDTVRSMHRSYAQKSPRQEVAMAMEAASQMAQSIDADVMQSISRKINGGNAGLNLAQPKGLLDKGLLDK